MIGFTSSTLRGFVNFTNNILGGIIGAHMQQSSGAWILANGVQINPSVASTSLLKGLAISGIGGATLVAPVVVAIKKLTTKMNSKQRYVGKYERKEEKNSDVNNTHKEKSSKKKAERKTRKDFNKLLSQFYKSGKTLDEFCNELELTVKEKDALKILDEIYQENVKKNRSRRKGNK